ncbi:MAG TPA: MFS transporter [Streptosporangiaceae bacterium]
MTPDLKAAAAGPAASSAAPAGGAFANRDFVKLWAGQTVSLIGTQVTQFAMPLVAVLTLNATVFQVGLLFAMRFVPVILLSVFAGVWLDRRRRRPVLISCAFGNAALIGLVPIAAETGILSIGLLYVVTALVGTLNMAFDVRALSYVPQLVEPRHLAESNGRIQASTAFAGVSGPALAGVLVGLITAPITLSVDAVSYLFSAFGLISIRKPEPDPEIPAHRPSVLGSIAEGFRAVYGSRLLRALLTQSTTLNLFFGSFITIFVVYAVRTLGLSPFQLSIVMGAAAAGGLLGALSAARVRNVLGFGRSMAVATICMAAAPLLLLIPRHAGPLSVAVLAIGQLIYGGSVSMFNVNGITLRQVVTPRRLLARMNATYRMLLFGVAPIGGVMGGLLGGALGLRSGLMISLILMTSPAGWLVRSPVFRLAEMPPGPPPAPGAPGHLGPPQATSTATDPAKDGENR